MKTDIKKETDRGITICHYYELIKINQTDHEKLIHDGLGDPRLLKEVWDLTT
ncbi:MAG: hypothetical protein RMX68_016600 [Aulosira sp. ZfuVER01]|nr:hypothetical protein [Aulosira sp. DedVER01a]MDZ8055887.1 hypothetical protein [Aulosira sp. ZfuCHP01]